VNTDKLPLLDGPLLDIKFKVAFADFDLRKKTDQQVFSTRLKGIPLFGEVIEDQVTAGEGCIPDANKKCHVKPVVECEIPGAKSDGREVVKFTMFLKLTKLTFRDVAIR
jgi:hypothetical protein